MNDERVPVRSGVWYTINNVVFSIIYGGQEPCNRCSLDTAPTMAPPPTSASNTYRPKPFEFDCKILSQRNPFTNLSRCQPPHTYPPSPPTRFHPSIRTNFWAMLMHIITLFSSGLVIPVHDLQSNLHFDKINIYEDDEQKKKKSTRRSRKCISSTATGKMGNDLILAWLAYLRIVQGRLFPASQNADKRVHFIYIIQYTNNGRANVSSVSASSRQTILRAFKYWFVRMERMTVVF